MTVTKALEQFTFKLTKVWKATPIDIDAYNTLADFVEKNHKRQTQDFHLFAKLYIMVYALYLKKYKATVFDDIPKKELHKLLSKPTSYFIELFTDRLNESELYSLFNDLNIDMEQHPATKTKEQDENEVDVLQEALKDEEAFNKFTGKIWDYETVKDNLEAQINNVINKYN